MAAERKLLILGSSVCTGAGASNPAVLGWNAKLKAALSVHGVEVLNMGIPGTVTKYWNAVLRGPAKAEADPRAEVFFEAVATSDIVLMSLSTGNEGLSRVRGPEPIARIQRHFTDGYASIAEALRTKMKPGARLVLGGPYPNTDYGPAHLVALKQIYAEMHQWDAVDHVIDFLLPVVHKGAGQWHDGAWVDPGHPNDAGHDQMFRCLNIEAILGGTTCPFAPCAAPSEECQALS